MAYKSLLTVLTDTETSVKRLVHMEELASAWDAHAETLCLGVDRSQTGYYYAGANAMILQQSFQQAQEESEALAGQAKAALDGSGIRWSSDQGVTQLGDLSRHVARHARFNDLVVLGKPYDPVCRAEAEVVTEAALFGGNTPVLMIPDDCAAPTTPRTVLVAWNESREAMNAIRGALPLLKKAEQVRLVVINPPQHSPDRSDPGGLLAQFLTRHGVRCDIDILGKTLALISDVLTRHAVDTSADMVVMGAYGHSRFRESILGGATRNMLEQDEIPVFLAH
ncbi:MAG: universal stress protein [Paracoccaceae bacterium]